MGERESSRISGVQCDTQKMVVSLSWRRAVEFESGYPEARGYI